MILMIYLALILGFAIWGLDRQLCLKDVEKDLKLLLGDFLIARDSSSGRIRTHYEATVVTLKTLIRNHFKDI